MKLPLTSRFLRETLLNLPREYLHQLANNALARALPNRHAQQAMLQPRAHVLVLCPNRNRETSAEVSVGSLAHTEVLRWRSGRSFDRRCDSHFGRRGGRGRARIGERGDREIARDGDSVSEADLDE